MERLTERNWLFFFTPTHPQPGVQESSGFHNSLRGTRNAITPKKADNKALRGWWKYWRQQGKRFLQGESRKIKDHDWQKIFELYYAVIFSGISFQMQMAFHPECISCQLPRVYLKLQKTPATMNEMMVYQTASKWQQQSIILQMMKLTTVTAAIHLNVT
jgi:hypothetical protein